MKFRYLLIIVCVSVFMFIFGGSYIINTADNSFRNQGEVCNDFTPLDSEYNCCVDCKKLDIEYFRYESSYSMLGADVFNCYCMSEDKDVKQIW